MLARDGGEPHVARRAKQNMADHSTNDSRDHMTHQAERVGHEGILSRTVAGSKRRVGMGPSDAESRLGGRWRMGRYVADFDHYGPFHPISLAA